MIAYRFDDNGLYIGEQECQIDPLATKAKGEPVYLLPAFCTFTKPLKPKDGYLLKWSGAEWIYEEIPVWPEPEPYISTIEEQIAGIDAQYKADKEELINYFVEFLIEDNVEGQQAIKDEMALLDSQYDADIMALSE